MKKSRPGSGRVYFSGFRRSRTVFSVITKEVTGSKKHGIMPFSAIIPYFSLVEISGIEPLTS
jgi:hypothetical protein